MNAHTTTAARARIAVIDDDAVFVDLMRDLLAESEGYDVVSATDWLRSVELVRDAQPDLIILDLMLGRAQSGLDVLELLRADPAIAQIPVILCSAAAPALRACPAAAQGQAAVETVAKPFDVDELLAVIDRLLRSRSTTPR